MLSGMAPVSKFPTKSSCCRLTRFPISDGMTPDMLLMRTRSNWSLVDKLANELGSFSTNLFHRSNGEHLQYGTIRQTSNKLSSFFVCLEHVHIQVRHLKRSHNLRNPEGKRLWQNY